MSTTNSAAPETLVLPVATTVMSPRRAAVLREMGLAPLWRLRSAPVEKPLIASSVPIAPTVTGGEPVTQLSAHVVAQAIVQPFAQQQPLSADAPNQTNGATESPQYDNAAALAEVPTQCATDFDAIEDLLCDLAAERYTQREEQYNDLPMPVAVVDREQQRRRAIATMGWEALRVSVAECSACELCKERKQAVLGIGEMTADWLLVGEGPGAEEDVRGEPFVGQAGKLLDAMLASIHLKRGENVSITNAVKCRPPGDRTPTTEELAACRPYLERQIALLQPKLVLALGRQAAQSLLQTEVKIASVRGKLQQYRASDTSPAIPLVVTYHPAYLLRTLTDKAKAWEDLCLARRTLRGLDGSSAPC